NVGYTNRSNFNRLFKKYKGMSPTQYRQRFR
ncbi:helix-turn-helix domain-containing protein, partial [Vibrio nigripulchritudo]